MRCWVVILVLTTGCRQLFGIGDTQLGDGDASSDGSGNSDHCYGSTNLRFCLDTLPSNTLIVPATIDTGANSTLCATTQPRAWSIPNQPDACFVIARDLTVSSSTTATGSRPLVLVGTEMLTLHGQLSVAAVPSGVAPPAGFAPNTCAAFQATPGSNLNGGGGGAGGTLGTRGADGGLGNQTSAAGIAAIPGSVTTLHSGCPGQNGGGGGAAGGGVGGVGGGAVYLVGGVSMVIASDATINASGAGGGAGGQSSGGGGGGSGGMIALWSPQFTAGTPTVLIANGGGGAGGGDNNNNGTPGGFPDLSRPAQPAVGGNGPGGNGGSGYALGSDPNRGLDGAIGDGGGAGGGGAGYIVANAVVGVMSSSPAIKIVP